MNKQIIDVLAVASLTRGECSASALTNRPMQQILKLRNMQQSGKNINATHAPISWSMYSSSRRYRLN